MIKITDVRVHLGDGGFLIDDGTTAVLYDSSFGFTGKKLTENIEKALGVRPLDYIFLTHSHYDHALGAGAVKKRWPHAKIVTGELTAKLLEKPTVRAHMQELDRKIAANCGVTDYDLCEDFLHADVALRDGEAFAAGDMVFTYLALPGHTRCSGGYYLAQEKLLLGCESLGVFGDEEEVLPTCLVGYQMCLDAIDRVRRLDVSRVLVPHHGLIEGAQAARYLARCRESTEKVAELICSVLCCGGTKEEAVAAFREAYYHGSVCIYYPREAMELNTGLMVDLFQKELLEKPVI